MGERMYELYCGNYGCSTRLAGQTHMVFESEIEDGEVWVCRGCHQPVAFPAPSDLPRPRPRPAWQHYYDGCRDTAEWVEASHESTT